MESYFNSKTSGNLKVNQVHDQISSVWDETSELWRPVLWCFFLGVVPPVLFLPSVEFGSSWCEEPCECFATSEYNPVNECNTDITSDFSSSLSSSNDECNEDPQGDNPSHWYKPGDGSIVELLGNSFLVIFEISKQPKGPKSSENGAMTVVHHTPSVPFSLSQKFSVTTPWVIWSPGTEDDLG